MLSEVPEGWSARTVGEFVSIKTGKLDANAAVKGGEYKFFTCAVEDSEIDNYAFDGDYVIIAGNGDFNVKHYVGKFNAYQRTYAVTSTSLESLDNTFLYFWQMHSLQRLRDLSVGGVIKYLKLGMIRDAEIALPPLNEQHRIAEILASVDASIQATQAVIEQAERVKRGLMEELLTGGLGSEAIERGEVPEGWQLLPLGEFAKIKNGFAFKSKEFLSDDAADKDVSLVVRMSDFNGGYVDTSRCKRIQKTTADGLEKFRLLQGDILVAMSGATVGKLGRVPATSSELYLNQRVGCMQPTQCIDEFLWQLVNTPFFQATVLAAATGNAQPNISSKELEKIQFALPPDDMQHRIVSALTAFDDFIAKHKAIVEQQARTKRGLMDDLLTGKVRTLQ